MSVSGRLVRPSHERIEMTFHYALKKPVVTESLYAAHMECAYCTKKAMYSINTVPVCFWHKDDERRRQQAV
jgi:hypothetical protein